MAIEILVVFRATAILSRMGVNLKFLFKTPPARNTLLAQKQPSEQANGCKFGFGAFLFQSNFEHATCILHHFAFLVCCRFMFLPAPNCCFLPLKTHFLGYILPFWAMYLMVLEGCIYTIVADIYAFCLAFSGILNCVLHHFTSRLAAKRLAFSGILQCIQHQNARYFAPKRSAFSSKQPKSWCKWWFV